MTNEDKRQELVEEMARAIYEEQKEVYSTYEFVSTGVNDKRQKVFHNIPYDEATQETKDSCAKKAEAALQVIEKRLIGVDEIYEIINTLDYDATCNEGFKAAKQIKANLLGGYNCTTINPSSVELSESNSNTGGGE